MTVPHPFDANEFDGSDIDDDEPVWSAGEPNATGRIVVHVQGNGLVFNTEPPFLIIDGNQMVNRHYGFNQVDVQPGQHQVELYSQSMRRFGFASATVDVPPGGLVELFYAVPAMMYYSKGNLGTTPQRHPGVVALIASAVATIVIAALIVQWVN